MRKPVDKHHSRLNIMAFHLSHLSINPSSPSSSHGIVHYRMDRNFLSPSLGLGPRQRLMQMSWKSISQLTCVRRQIHVDLPQIINHRLSCSFIATKLRACQVCALSVAGYNCPH